MSDKELTLQQRADGLDRMAQAVYKEAAALEEETGQHITGVVIIDDDGRVITMKRSSAKVLAKQLVGIVESLVVEDESGWQDEGDAPIFREQRGA